MNLSRKRDSNKKFKRTKEKREKIKVKNVNLQTKYNLS